MRSERARGLLSILWADRFHLLDALCDQSCWENRGLAVSIIHGCSNCRQVIARVLAQAMAEDLAGQNGDGDGKIWPEESLEYAGVVWELSSP